MQILWNILEATWDMSLDAAPWLCVGLIVAALIKVYVPSDWLTHFLKGRGGVIKAAFIGAPLPLCSCGVIPAALALRRQGASRGSTMSFLVATPETGVDSIAVSYALLGPLLTIARPISAVCSAIATGLIGAALPAPEPASPPQPAASGGCGGSRPEPAPAKASCCSAPPEPATASSCCGSQTERQPEPVSTCCGAKAQAEPEPVASCCSGKTDPEPEAASSCCGSAPKAASSCCGSSPADPDAARPGLLLALTDAAGQILGDTAKWLLIGLFMAGAISAFIEPGQFAELGSGLGVMLLMAVVGIPMYICAVASTPLAASLLIAGLSPGAVLVFMLAGPATNIATLGVVRKELGMRYMVAYLLSVGVSAILCGLATDAAAAALGVNVAAQAQDAHHHGMVPHWLAVVCLVALVALAIKPLRMRLAPPTPQPA